MISDSKYLHILQTGYKQFFANENAFLLSILSAEVVTCSPQTPHLRIGDEMIKIESIYLSP